MQSGKLLGRDHRERKGGCYDQISPLWSLPSNFPLCMIDLCGEKKFARKWLNESLKPNEIVFLGPCCPRKGSENPLNLIA